MKGPADPERLLEQRAWALRLAKGLVGHAEDAEDIAQEALASAWREGPRRPRAWIARVVRNLAATRLRRGERLARRERAAGRPEAAPSTAALAARAELLRLVIDEMLALPADAREVLLLRYVEDLAPAEIARRLGRPPGTVRSQIKRALDALRARLDARRGGRSAWALPLLAWLAPPRAAAAASLATTGGLLMATHTKTAMLAGLLLLVALTGWSVTWLAPRGGAPARTAEAPRAPAPTTTAAGERALQAAESASATVPRVAVTGFVRRAADDAPVAGASVAARAPVAASADRWVEAMAALLAPREPLGEARTGANGRFRLDVERGRTVDLVAGAPGLAPLSLRGIALPADVEDLVLRLGPGSVVEGIVVDESGAGIAGARVRVRPPGSPSAATDADGRFRLDGVEAGECAVAVSLEGHPGRFVPGVIAPAHDLVIELGACAPLEGAVLEAGEQAPVAGARVVMTGNGVWPSPLFVEARTDAAGRYRIPHAPVRGYFSLAVDGGAAGRATLQRLTWEQRRLVERILLGPATTLRGRVVRRAEDGTPAGVPGVLVGCFDEWSGWGLGAVEALSGEDGRFALVGVGAVPGVVATSARETDWTTLFGARPRALRELEVEVGAAARVSGRVLDAAGAPVGHAQVSVVYDRGGSALAASDGRFTVSVPPSGPKEAFPGLRAEALGRFIQRPLPKLSPGERLDGFDLVLPALPASEGARGTGVLAGRSVDGAGRPVAGARVRLHAVRRFGSNVAFEPRGEATTAADGGWRIEGLAAETLRLRIERSGYLAVERDGVRVGDDATDLGELAMAPALRLLGRVVDAAGRPVRGRAVRVESGRVREVVRTGRDGAFAFEDAFPGRWTVRVAEPTTGAPVVVDLPASAPVVVVADDGDAPETGPFVEGLILDVHGRPAPGTQLRWYRPGDTKGTWVPVALDGRFRVAVPGRVRLEAGWTASSDESERARQLWDPVEVEPGATGVQLRAHSGLSLEGTVAGAEGRLQVRADIEAEDAPPGGAHARAPVAPDGSFRLEGLRRAAYTLHLEGAGAWADPVRVVVTGGGERIVLRASPTLSIAGRVVAPAEWDHGMLKLVVERLDDGADATRKTIVRSGGAFRVDGLRAGRYRLTASCGAGRAAVEADAGDRDVVIDFR